DTVVWAVGDDRDLVDGGANTDTFVVNGDGSSETYRVYSRAAALAAGLAIAANTEIVITRNGTNNGSIIAELDNIEEIVINTGAGNDTVLPIGNFGPTSLSTSTITINGSSGDDTVDISSLASAHRILFRSNGGNDTIVGTLRPQDVIELMEGSSPADYVSTVNPNGTTTLSNGAHSITFASAGTPIIREEDDQPRGGFEMSQRDIDGLKKLINGQRPFADEDDADHALGVRTLSGAGNNEDNPEWGAADTPFIRLTEARYGDYDAGIDNRELNPIYEGLDPRAISNILGAQEAGLPHASNNANIFFMAFGQYFDHGLDFIPKNAVNGTVQIGAPGIGQPGQGNPADLTRGEVFAIDDEGVPQHLNKTSTFVDQNQAYGSHSLIGQFLRQGDGEGGLTSYLLKGAPDPSNPSFSLLPTLREAIQHHWDNNTVFTDPSLPGGQIAFRTYYSNYPVSETATGNLIGPDGAFDPQVYGKLANNFMGSGQPLLLDTNPFISLLDHYVAGDGRANENFTLTSMHTIWARNHNFHVDNLLASGFTGTEQELFEAAKVLNEAEYQRVVFTEFADALIGGIRGDGDHGNNGYNPDADPGISHEFAAAVYRVGHSLIGQTITVMDANGQPKQVALFDAFLNPSNDADVFTMPLSQLAQYGYVPQPGYEQYGINPILEGIATQPAEQVDFNIVDAVRNDLVRIQADLFSFNVARGRDVGLGTLNQIRKDLAASQNSYVAEAVGYAGNMSAYASWEDFQARNGLSDTVIAQFKQAYPDLVLDTPEKLAAFVAANPDIALVNGNTVKGIDRVDLWVGGLAEKHINGGMVGQTFWVVLHEQFDRLQEADRFYYKDRLEAFDFYEEFIDGQEFADIIARNTGLTDLPENIFEVNDEDDEGEDDGQGDDDEDDDDDDGASSGGDDEDADDDEDDDDTSSGGDDDDDGDDPSCGCDDDDDGPGTPAPNPNPATGGALRSGTAAADVLIGTAGADNLVGLAGDDTLTGHGGADAISAGEGADFVDAGDGRDVVFAGAGDDQVFGGGGADMLYGEAGNDRIFGGAGDDLIDAGAGNDTVVAGSGDDLIIAAAGDGDDTYFGDEIDGGTGIDTLDFSAITANLTVDLGNGLNGRGQAVSSQSGTDTLWGIENVATGSGNDTITASEAVNVMEGGAGNDTFRFLSAAGADGDTILDFQPGDRLDLSAIDADATQAGNQSFTLANGGSFTASAQLTVTYETRADGAYTIVKGNVDAATDAEFQINLKGSHNLTGSNFIV
ncbi:peroxidase family protein, partial [Bosea sp. CER48]|uniref:peroxidase family protein n=1 Tax=Bosea sp. CER48 TaxID=3377035 RepID=UPI003826D003